MAPGPIWTPLIPATFDEEHVAEFGKSTTIGRPGQPCGVAPAYVFLASENASYISAQVIHVNGEEAVEGCTDSGWTVPQLEYSGNIWLSK